MIFNMENLNEKNYMISYILTISTIKINETTKFYLAHLDKYQHYGTSGSRKILFFQFHNLKRSEFKTTSLIKNKI